MIWYAWYPVRLSKFNYEGRYWYRTGKWTWFATVECIRTMWGEWFYRKEEEQP